MGGALLRCVCLAPAPGQHSASDWPTATIRHDSSRSTGQFPTCRWTRFHTAPTPVGMWHRREQEAPPGREAPANTTTAPPGETFCVSPGVNEGVKLGSVGSAAAQQVDADGKLLLDVPPLLTRLNTQRTETTEASTGRRWYYRLVSKLVNM